MEIGERLKEARLNKGVSYQDVEEATKIRARYLEALETENFELLPGRVYVIAFIRNYARFLDLDDEELVNQYKEQHGDREVVKELTTDNDVSAEVRGDKPKILNYLLAILVIAVAVAAFAYYYQGQGLNTIPNETGEPDIVQDEDKTPDEEPDETGDEDGANESPDPALKYEGVELVLNVTNDRCWMRVDVDGQRAFEGTLGAGESKKFTGNESVYIKLGNAGVVEVEYNGESLGTLDEVGQTYENTFTIDQS
ncbi:MAG: helix-turn-helix domain-containing protein [Firmicutes bacterium]|nr:helix-turn-helix domain-containing protein [Bacillota bacterium]